MGQENSKITPGKQTGSKIEMTTVADEVRRIWMRNVSELPLSKDIPRLARNFVFVGKNGLEVKAYKSAGDTPRMHPRMRPVGDEGIPLPKPIMTRRTSRDHDSELSSSNVALDLHKEFSAAASSSPVPSPTPTPTTDSPKPKGVPSISLPPLYASPNKRPCNRNSNSNSSMDEPLPELSISTDDPSAVNKDGKMDPLMQAVLFILRSVCEALDPSALIVLTPANFQQNVNLNSNSSLGQFVLDFIGEQSKAVRLLKVCNQSILAPAITQMKKALHGKVEYKDVHGGWKLMVDLHSQHPSVTHVRREQVIAKIGQGICDYKNVFQFEWSLKIEFAPNVSDITSLSMKLIDVNLMSNSAEPAVVPLTRVVSTATTSDDPEVQRLHKEFQEKTASVEIPEDEKHKLENALRTIVLEATSAPNTVEAAAPAPAPTGWRRLSLFAKPPSSPSPAPASDDSNKRMSFVGKLASAARRLSLRPSQPSPTPLPVLATGPLNIDRRRSMSK